MTHKERHTHVIDKRFNTSVERSARVLEVGEAFGLGMTDKEFVVFDNVELSIDQGDCVYITGQSGSGKSVLLRELTKNYRELGKKVGVLDEMELIEKPLIDQLGTSTDEACQLLSLSGLNDAYLMIRKPSELSDGQRYRFKIALLIANGYEVIAADEFGAVLDRTTAKVVAYSIRKLCERKNITMLVATTHKDLFWDLRPTLTIDKTYSDEIDVRRADPNSFQNY